MSDPTLLSLPPRRPACARQRIVVGLSGGVDSAVTAWLLKRQGHEVVGIFMKNWEGDDDDAFCSSRQDFVDAAAVADVIGIELEHVNFAADYRERVFAEFLREYRAGRTPNPDVLCNAEIKFKAFLDHAVRLGAERIATGHYARVRERGDGSVELLRGRDASKDQSYFLHRLSQAQLARALFPVGELEKREVRRIAAEIGLPNAAKKDSTGICFIGERPFRAFLQQWLANSPGPIVELGSGRTLGRHDGLSFHTIGQRKGLGIGGIGGNRGNGSDSDVKTRAAAGAHAPWFVAGKDMAGNRLLVVQGHDHPALLARGLAANDASWIAGVPPKAGTRLAAKTRYRQADAACTVVASDGNALVLAFDEPQWAVAPGQSAVLYDGEVCLGGAAIDVAHAGPPGRESDLVRATTPVDATAKPVGATARPVDATAKPVDATAKPVDAAAKPVDATAKPVDAAAKPVDAAAKPVDAAAKPVILSEAKDLRRLDATTSVAVAQDEHR